MKYLKMKSFEKDIDLHNDLKSRVIICGSDLDSYENQYIKVTKDVQKFKGYLAVDVLLANDKIKTAISFGEIPLEIQVDNDKISGKINARNFKNIKLNNIHIYESKIEDQNELVTIISEFYEQYKLILLRVSKMINDSLNKIFTVVEE